jgi:nucleoside phosphorylase
VLIVVAATERELSFVQGVVTFCCGVGPVDAAVRTARVLAERRPDTLLHVGIAGARGIDPPALVLGSEAVYEDARDTNLVQTRVEPDAALLGKARAALPEALVLPIGTSAHVGGTSVCDVEAMEGFAVLRAAQLAGVPALELRVISNAVDEPDRAAWRFDDAFSALGDAVTRLVAALA